MMDKFFEKCRLCMGCDNVDIFMFSNNTLLEIIKSLLEVQVNLNDNLPKKICMQCFRNIDLLSKFRNIVRETDTKYKILLAATESNIIVSNIVSNNYISSPCTSTSESMQSTTDLTMQNANMYINTEVQTETGIPVIKTNPHIVNLNPKMETFAIMNSMPYNTRIIQQDPDTMSFQADGSVLVTSIHGMQQKPTNYENIYTCTSQPGVSGMQNDLVKQQFTNIPITYQDNGMLTDHIKHEGGGEYFIENYVDNRLFAYRAYPQNEIPNSQTSFESTEQVEAMDQSVTDSMKQDIDDDTTSTMDNEPDLHEEPLDDTEDDPKIDTTTGTPPPVDTQNSDEPQKSPKPVKPVDKFPCPQCDLEFTSNLKLSYHTKSVHEERKFQCTVCERKFMTAHHLKMHSAMHVEVKPFPCDECTASFTYKKLLESHKLTKHIVSSGDAQFPFACSVCEMKFSSRNTYNHHAKSHRGNKGPFPCDVCGKDLATKESLNCHKLMHTGEKTLLCEICNKAFSHRKYYAVHKRVHTGERPYTCTTCGKSFTQASTLTVHKRYHSGERPYICSICDKGFVTRTIMVNHMKKHST
ncbi:zinc finger protein 567-like [Ctenocephalides felis]|uniref:zinc finger protein 567-like n=1 Tax=Ctenocephalides felis TaxID=7515 RepID=UPI000E6E14D9|nr:zinc finger protein 567-like [Ctenocephalides felis]